MDIKEILEFVYKIVQIMNGVIDIVNKLYAVNDRKKSKPLYIRKRANACKTLTQRSEKNCTDLSDQKLIILFLAMELNKRGYFDDLR